MKLFRTNEYISLDIFNYFMFFANIGFIIYFLSNIAYVGQLLIEFMYRASVYYKFAIPTCIIILMYYLLSEKKDKRINSKVQKTITTVNFSVFFLVIINYVIIFLFVAYFAHGLDF
ncbi:hypothetical protein IKQ21_09890 [bacterium]|nr:hypothetical protein [bacterium]